MTNLSPKYLRQRGAATLIIAVIMLATITLIILFGANLTIFEEKVTGNSIQNSQAYEAAEAGLEFGLTYFQANESSITASHTNGYLNPYTSTATQNVALTDGSKFTISYSNPIQNNYSEILVSSVGTSSDNTSTHTVSQLAYQNGLLSTPPSIPLVTKGAVNMSGNAIVSNPTASSTINSASTVSFTGNSKTMLPGGITGSSSATTKSDVVQNNSTTSAMSNTTFFQTYFGSTEASVQATVAHSYTNTSSTDYTNTLNGLSGTSVWINQSSGTANIAGNAVVGSAANPVLIIVNGSLNISGNATIYGFIYVIGGVVTGLSGNTSITGGVVSSDTMNISGNTTIIYSSSVLSNLQKQFSAGYFAKVPGMWKDF